MLCLQTEALLHVAVAAFWTTTICDALGPWFARHIWMTWLSNTWDLANTPWKINMNLKITHLKRKIIFQIFTIVFHVIFRGVFLPQSESSL